MATDGHTTSPGTQAFPQTFGGYILLKKLDEGGMAEVFLAQKRGPAGFEKFCVVKRILPTLTADQSFVDMFLDEARIAARLDHPNIAQVNDLGEVDGRYFMAMEYIDGLSFAQFIQGANQKKLRINPYLSAALVAQAAEALHYAHERKLADGTPMGLVHRDINPRNLMVSFSGQVKVLDFGIAKALGRLSKTQSGRIKGTLAYMAPEQLEGQVLDARTDLFSLGVVLYELLAQRRLFARGTQAETIRAILTEEYPTVRQRRDDVSPLLDAATAQLLSRLRDARFGSARDIKDALLDALMADNIRITASEVSDYLGEHFAEERQRVITLTEAPAVAGTTPTRVLAKPDGSVATTDTEVDRVFSPGEFLKSEGALASPESVKATRVLSPDELAKDPAVGARREQTGLTQEIDGVPALPPPPTHRPRTARNLSLAFFGVLALGVALLAWWNMGRADAPPLEKAGPVADADAPEKVPVKPALRAVTLTSQPPGATLMLDGKEVGVTPYAFNAKPGKKHTLVFSLTGYDALTTTWVESENPQPVFSVEMVRKKKGGKPASRPPVKGPDPKVEKTPDKTPDNQREIVVVPKAPGLVNINASPWANVRIDGKKQKKATPLQGIALSPGVHRIEFTHPPSGSKVERTITVVSGETQNVVVTMPLQGAFKP
jgi:serine/threonine-protein kinase